MKSIDEQITALENTLYEEHFVPDSVDFAERQAQRARLRIRLQLLLKEVARDQRHACAETINAVEYRRVSKTFGQLIGKDEAYQAVMNTPEPGK